MRMLGITRESRSERRGEAHRDRGARRAAPRRGAGKSLLSSLALGLLASGPSAADSIHESRDESLARMLLETLCSSGDITPERCAELRAFVRTGAVAVPDDGTQVAEEPAIGEPTPVAVATEEVEPPEPEDPTWDIFWKQGIKLQRSDGLYKFQFLGRIQLDWAGFANSTALDRNGFRDGFGVEMRRARLGMQGELWKRLVFKGEYDFAGGNSEFKDVFMGLKFDQLDWRVGHYKESFSLEQMASSRHMTFIERSLADIFVPARNTGMNLRTQQLGDRLTASAGFFLVSDDFADSFSNHKNYNITTRITGVPLYEDDGEKVIHLGIGYSHGFRHPDATPVLYEQKPEIHLADKIFTNDFSGDGISANHSDLVGLEVGMVYGPWSIQSEFMYNHVTGRGDTSNRDYKGAYVQLSYFITGEHRNYQLKKARFDRIYPNRNFDPTQGHWGAWQVAARYSHLDLRSDGNGTIGNNATVALNWYLYPAFRIAANYVYADREGRGEGDGHMNGFVTRFYVDW